RLLDFHLTVAVTTVACGLNHDAIPVSLVELTYTGMPLADMTATRSWLTTNPSPGHPPAVDARYRLVRSIQMGRTPARGPVAGRLLCAARGTVTDADEPVPAAAFSRAPQLLVPERMAAIETGLARVRTLSGADDERTAAQIGFVAAVSATIRGKLDDAR